MKRPMDQEMTLVTGLNEDREALLERRTIASLLDVLRGRAERLVEDRAIRERLRPLLGAFVENVVDYFDRAGELDAFVLTNIMTALVTADNHGPGARGTEDYSTFIRSLNPTAPDAGRYFVIGRAGRVTDPECPLDALRRGADGRGVNGRSADGLSNVPEAKLHVWRAFHHARSRESQRDAPRIPVADFSRLVPDAILCEPALEAAFLDVCLSDGAWALYQLELATVEAAAA